jgi:hypothetical protein
MSTTFMLCRDCGGRRHFLDGRPVHCGTVLEIYLPSRPGARWHRARYESTLQGDCEAWLTFDDDTCVRVREQDELRWPKGAQ